MRGGDRDWMEIQRRLLDGDRLAFLEVNRLVTALLGRMRAYDFRDEWDDLRQEVLAALVQNARRGRLRDPRAFVGYVRIITRNKFVDRLKSELRRRERDALPWDEETARAFGAGAGPDPGAAELWAEVERLPVETRALVEGVYREGKTYEEMSRDSGVPLGTLKRRLREGLSALRARLEERDDPVGPRPETSG